jgi:hypothetical protein
MVSSHGLPNRDERRTCSVTAELDETVDPYGPVAGRFWWSRMEQIKSHMRSLLVRRRVGVCRFRNTPIRPGRPRRLIPHCTRTLHSRRCAQSDQRRRFSRTFPRTMDMPFARPNDRLPLPACVTTMMMMMMLEAAQGMACVCRRYYLTRRGDEDRRCRFYIGRTECGKNATNVDRRGPMSCT